MTIGASVLLLALLGAASAQGAQVQSPPVFGVQVANVYVDVLASNGGDPVLGLDASNFELKDNGVTQRIELVSADSLPLLAVLAFDTSHSLAGEGLAALQEASLGFLASLRPGDEVALFTFADEVRWRLRPTTDRTAIRSAIQGIQLSDGTSVVDAVFAAVTLPQAPARTLVVIFTDGEDTVSWLDWGQIQAVVERSNALIHVVGLRSREHQAQVPDPRTGSGFGFRAGVGDWSDQGLEMEHAFALRRIAEATGGRFWEAESPGRLKSAFGAIAEAMGRRYVLRYEPQGVGRPGWHEIKLRLRGRKGEIHARKGYWATGP